MVAQVWTVSTYRRSEWTLDITVDTLAAGLYVGNHVVGRHPRFGFESFSRPAATSVQRFSCTLEIPATLAGGGRTVAGAVPEPVEKLEASQPRAVSWVRILVRDRGRECERLVATRLEQTVFNRLVDWGQHSMIPNGQPWLTVTFALTGVST